MMEVYSEWIEIMHIQVVTFTSDINRRDYENMVIEGALFGRSAGLNNKTLRLQF